jgi:thioredoxin-like negative regulator of GroEL
VFFHSERSGRCRRVEGYLAQVLQRRGNHAVFSMHHVDVDRQPELAARFGVTSVPTLVVLDGGAERARVDSPRGCAAIQGALAPWLR